MSVQAPHGRARRRVDPAAAKPGFVADAGRAARRGGGGRGRKPAPPPSPVWRFGFPGLLLALAAATVVLSIVGAQLVLDSRDGRVGRAELDPTKPGYLATVAPTPTFLVAHVDDGKLLSVVVLALGPNDTGGGAVVLSPNTWVQLEEGADSISLEAIYEQHGIEDVQTGEGLRAAVSTVLRADVDDYVELNARSLAPLIEPVAPLRYTLPDPVRERRGNGTVTVLPAGEVQIDTTDEIIAAIETLGPDEEVIRRTERQQRFWQAWIDAVRAAPDPAQAFPSGSSSTTIARFVRGLAAGEARVDILPYVRFEGILVADRDEIDDLARELIPFPRQEGVRVSVAVYNGVGDLSLNQSVLRQLIGAGAQIVSLGNTPSFGVETTSVAYHDPSLRSQAEALADAIGATDVRFDGKPESDIGVTVTIGADYVAP